MKRLALISLLALSFILVSGLFTESYARPSKRRANREYCSHNHPITKTWVPGYWERRRYSRRRVWVPGYWVKEDRCGKCTEVSRGKRHKKHSREVARRNKKHDGKNKFEFSIRLPGWSLNYGKHKSKPYRHNKSYHSYKPYCHLY